MRTGACRLFIKLSRVPPAFAGVLSRLLADLNVLFNNRAAIGKFNASGLRTWYWSSTEEDSRYAWLQPVSDGGPVLRSQILRRVRALRAGGAFFA